MLVVCDDVQVEVDVMMKMREEEKCMKNVSVDEMDVHAEMQDEMQNVKAIRYMHGKKDVNQNLKLN